MLYNYIVKETKNGTNYITSIVEFRFLFIKFRLLKTNFVVGSVK